MGSFRDYLELAYFASGPIIALVAIFGLRQIYVTKEAIAIRSKREALAITANQCLDYSTRIIPLMDALDEAITKNNCTLFKEDNWNVAIEKNEIKIAWKKPQPPNWNDINNIIGEITSLINSMESFALFFNSGVADELVAYHSVGNNFLVYARKIMPLIKMGQEHDGWYDNIIELYVHWSNRCDLERMILEKHKIDKRLKESYCEYKRPIGTDKKG